MNVEKIIRENIVGIYHFSLATSKDNKPWSCEVHFVYDDELNLYFRSRSTRRHSSEIETNPQVGGTITKQYALGEDCVGMYFEGICTMLVNDNDINNAAGYFEQRLNAKNVAEDAKKIEGHKIYKIAVSEWSIFGRFGGTSGQKYSLSWNDETANIDKKV